MSRNYFLIEPSDVIVEQADKANTEFNSLEREPVKQVARSEPVELLAQVSWARDESVEFKNGGQGGMSQGASGYLVFSIKQLAEKGVTLAKGDRVTSIAGNEVDVYLENSWQAGHRGRRPRHQYWGVTDKEPSKTNA